MHQSLIIHQSNWCPSKFDIFKLIIISIIYTNTYQNFDFYENNWIYINSESENKLKYVGLNVIIYKIPLNFQHPAIPKDYSQMIILHK